MPLRAIYKPEPATRRIAGFLLPYAAAAGLCAAALGLTRLLPNSIEKPFFPFFLCATGLVAWLFGAAAGVASVAFDAIAMAYLVLPPIGILAFKSSEDELRLLVFVALSLVVVLVLARWRQTQRALQVSQERFELAHSIANIWAWEMELPSGTVIWSSSARVTKQARSEPPRVWLQKIHPEDQQKVLAALKSAADTGHPYQTEFRVITATGEIRWMASSGEFYKTGGGEQRMIGVNVDITVRKKAEEALEVAAKVEMAGDLAHQINNPLQGLIHSLYLLHEQAGSTDAAQYSQVAQSEAERVSQLVAQILRLYKKGA